MKITQSMPDLFTKQFQENPKKENLSGYVSESMSE